MTKKPNHYHVHNDGRIIEHFHTTLGGDSMRAHVHEGIAPLKFGYATTRRAIARKQRDWLVVKDQRRIEHADRNRARVLTQQIVVAAPPQYVLPGGRIVTMVKLGNGQWGAPYSMKCVGRNCARRQFGFLTGESGTFVNAAGDYITNARDFEYVCDLHEKRTAR